MDAFCSLGVEENFESLQFIELKASQIFIKTFVNPTIRKLRAVGYAGKTKTSNIPDED